MSSINRVITELLVLNGSRFYARTIVQSRPCEGHENIPAVTALKKWLWKSSYEGYIQYLNFIITKHLLFKTATSGGNYSIRKKAMDIMILYHYLGVQDSV